MVGSDDGAKVLNYLRTLKHPCDAMLFMHSHVEEVYLVSNKIRPDSLLKLHFKVWIAFNGVLLNPKEEAQLPKRKRGDPSLRIGPILQITGYQIVDCAA